MGAPDTELTICVTVKAYPAISTRHGEVVCVAGIRTDSAAPEWVRLWPIDFRGLDRTLQFEKYEEIRVRAQRSTRDTRPESWLPDMSTVARTGRRSSTAHNWQARRRIVEPLMTSSMCDLLRREKVERTSLGVFRPREVLDVLAKPNEGAWTQKQLGHLGQLSFLSKSRRALERIPFDFKLRYLCADSACKSHTQGIVDWELMQAYRGWSGTESDKVEKVRKKWLGELCGPDRDTALFVGNQHQAPQGFLVLGVFWPRTENQLSLEFDKAQSGVQA